MYISLLDILPSCQKLGIFLEIKAFKKLKLPNLLLMFSVIDIHEK